MLKLVSVFVVGPLSYLIYVRCVVPKSSHPLHVTTCISESTWTAHCQTTRRGVPWLTVTRVTLSPLLHRHDEFF